ncbi:MAG: phosphatidylglycerol lysyltransferase domain-containing protein, partial [Sphingomonadaceae bacterium]
MREAGGDGRRAGIRARLPQLLGLALFVLALVALRHLLDEIDPARLAAELRAMPPWRIGLAILSSILGYVALAGYDWSALAYVGKRLPLATVVPGGMVAYAVSNSVGFAALSGTAIRWRLYRPLGLEARDLAVMAVFMSAAFVVAGCLIGLAALAIRPEALAHLVTLPPGQVRALSLLAIATIMVPLVWASRSGHALGVRGRTVRVPPPALLLRQLAISTADIGLAALTLWILLPAAEVGPFTFAAVYAVALLAGVLSGVPGGIGVFETVLLAGLPDTVGTERLAAALLLYRLVYHLLPLFAALLFLGWQEASRRSLGGRVSGRAAELAGTVAPLAPPILAAVLLGAGLWLNLFAVIPAPAALADGGTAMLSAAGLEAATLSMSILGVGLVILALGVRRRRRAAYWLAIAALLAGALLLTLKMHHPLHAIGFAGLALALLPFRQMFHRPSLLGALTLQPGWLALVAGFLGLVLLALFLAHRETPYAAELWWQFAADAHAPRALRAAFASALLLSAASLALLLKAPPLRPTAPSPEALARAEAIARAGDDPDAAFALMGDKALLFAPDDEAFVMYAVSGRCWIALYGPVGPPEPAAEAAFRFVDAARQAGDWPVFYEVAERDVPLMLELGLLLYKMGEEAVVELAGFGLEGPARRKLRMAHGRGVRAGL